MKGTVKHEILRLLLEYVYFKTKRGKIVTSIKDSHNDNDQKGHKIFEVQRLQKTIEALTFSRMCLETPYKSKIGGLASCYFGVRKHYDNTYTGAYGEDKDAVNLDI